MRAKNSAARNRRKKRLFKAAEGYWGARRKLYRTVKEAVMRAGKFAYRDRRTKRRNFRALWIVRVSAASAERGIRYSQFINGLKKANIELDRKSLSEIAIYDPPAFDAIAKQVKAALGISA